MPKVNHDRGVFEGDVLARLDTLQEQTAAVFKKLDALPCTKHEATLAVLDARMDRVEANRSRAVGWLLSFVVGLAVAIAAWIVTGG